MSQAHLVLFHQAFCVVPYRSCEMHNHKAGLPAELIMTEAGLASQSTLDARL